MMGPLEAIRAVRAYLSDPKKWGRYYIRNDITGQMCVAGALFHVQGCRKEDDPAIAVLASRNPKVARGGFELPIYAVTGCNDSCSHSEVLAWLDDCIDHLEKATDEKAKRGVAELKETLLEHKQEMELA